MENTYNLPEKFKIMMSDMLGNEYQAFLDSFKDEPSKAVHINTSATGADIPMIFADFLEKLEYTDNGYKSSISKIGQHPLFHSGIVYSQDPGAMMPVAALPNIFEEGDYVLDLCAAPGGKTSQLATILSQAGGYLVSNEPVANRNKILRSNVERMGYKNVTVTGLMPAQLSQAFPGLFKLIVIDAPCSGEGMFRKYPESIGEWSPENVLMCSQRQKEIIDSIMPALSAGGYILYSTCTYSYEEDEEIVKYLTEKYEMDILELPEKIKKYGTSFQGEPGIHFFPHKAYGEGQYLCVLKHRGDYIRPNRVFKNILKPVSKPVLKMIEDALGKNFDMTSITFYEKDKRIILVPSDNPYCEKGVTSYGILAGDILKNRFVPHHQLFKGGSDYFKNKVELSDNENLLFDYLKGQEILCDTATNGYGVITYYGAPVGGFKCSNGRLKNHYPKGLRNL